MFLLILEVVLMMYVNCTHPLMPEVFTTEHLRAEKVTNVHVPYLTDILSNQQVQEIYNTIDEASFTNIAMQLSIIQDQWHNYGYGLYIMFNKETSEFIGFAGYHTITIDALGTINCFDATQLDQELEIYIFLMPHQWGKGYGFEVMTTLISLAFKHLPYTSIIAYIDPKNSASLRLINKLHFTEEHMVMYNTKPHVLYRLYKEKDVGNA